MFGKCGHIIHNETITTTMKGQTEAEEEEETEIDC